MERSGLQQCLLWTLLALRIRVKVYIQFLAAHEGHISHTMCQEAPGHRREIAEAQQDVLHFRGTQQYLMSVRHKKIITLKNIHSFNITLCDIPFNDVMSLRSWISWSCCDKKQVASRNQYERGNKEGNIQSDPKDWEAVQCMRGTSIQSLVYNCGYLRLK